MMRMRSTLTSTGKNINLKSAAYKVKCLRWELYVYFLTLGCYIDVFIPFICYTNVFIPQIYFT